MQSGKGKDYCRRINIVNIARAEIEEDRMKATGKKFYLLSNAAVLGGWINLNKLIEDLNMIFVLTKSSKEEEKCAIQDVVIYL